MDKKTPPVRLSGPEGFTLIELIIVIVLIGVVMAVVMPRLTGLRETYLKSDTVKVSALIGYINEAAITRKVYYRVWFDITDGRLRVETSRDGVTFESEAEGPLRALRLSNGVEITDVVIPALGKIESGAASFVFPPGGASESFTMHLKAGEKSMTLYFNPLSGKVLAEEGYLAFGMDGNAPLHGTGMEV